MILIRFFIILFLVGCAQPVKKEREIPQDWSKDHSVSYHKEVNEREQLSISLYLEQHQALKKNIRTTESGLRYAIVQPNPKGVLGRPGKTASLILNVGLLDGTQCYATDSDMYDEIPIDRNDKESGLNEALKLMRTGERARLILPNHLAHGLVGDLANIPPLAILVLDVTLIDVQ
jgi:FKBP-type peptidyl-prolyl cis-trans isomerase